MTPGTFNFVIDRGVKFGPYTLTCKDAVGTAGVAVDLTGWSVQATARKLGAVAFDLAPAITVAAQGKIRFVMTDTETDALAVGHYTWDLVLENPSGERMGPYISGSVTVSELNSQID